MEHIIKRITPKDGQYFFGYYDLQPFSPDNTLHLVHRAPFIDRLQKKGDSCDIGLIDLRSGAYEKLADTQAWNFQQGAMLLWALENALFLSNYVVDLCDRYDDPAWLRQQLLKFDAFSSQVDVLRQYYTDFSMPSEYQSRIGIHKEFLNSLLHSA